MFLLQGLWNCIDECMDDYEWSNEKYGEFLGTTHAFSWRVRGKL
jgi:hypothetical protein